MSSLLSHIQSPADLKTLAKTQLEKVCSELREFIIDNVSEHGGHFAANLGVVELTVALHYVFDAPADSIVWDVGHQAYAHKILTGRRDQFHTNRKSGGLSGFPKMSESPYDAFGTGHSSTSVSAVLGMATASLLKGEDHQHIAIIGDGALSAGQAFEGLNNAAVSHTNILIILNDNHIGIDPNAGALNDYLSHIDFTGNNLFTDLGFQYYGPVDGHDVNTLVTMLDTLKHTQGPKLFHIKTKKGKGYAPAEAEQTKWHSTQAFDKISGKNTGKAASETPKFQDVFGHTLLELALNNDRVVAVTPAMISGSSLHLMQQQLPERVFDVAIAEQHAVTFSAGMAAAGMIPFCSIYSTFLQRAYDQLIHDVALQKLPVIFAIDRAGLVGDDGPTHHGVFDLAFLLPIPNMIIAAPLDEHELRSLMHTAVIHREGPFAIRYPRGNGFIKDWKNTPEILPVGKGRQLREGKDIAILSIGTIGQQVIAACDMAAKQGIEVAHYDMRFAKPVDTALLDIIFHKYPLVIVVEDGAVAGGFGNAVKAYAVSKHYTGNVTCLGIPDAFIEHGKTEVLYASCGIDAAGILATAVKLL